MKLRKLRKNNQAVFSWIISLVVIGTIIIFISTFIAPMSIQMNVAMFEAGEDILEESQETIARLNNATVAAALDGYVQAGIDSTTENINIWTYLYRYSWLIGLLAVTLVIFMYARSKVENLGGVI